MDAVVGQTSPVRPSTRDLSSRAETSQGCFIQVVNEIFDHAAVMLAELQMQKSELLEIDAHREPRD